MMMIVQMKMIMVQVVFKSDQQLNELEILKSPSRKRIILPYLRRLVETKKSAAVTQKRIESMSDVVEPDEEIKQVFNEKYNELLNVGNVR